MLGGDYITYEKKAAQTGGTPHCRTCKTSEKEDITHMIAKCKDYAEAKNRVNVQYSKLCT